MKKYSVITLRPNNRADIADYNEFRRSDIVDLYFFFLIYKLCSLLFVGIVFFFTRGDLDKVIWSILQTCFVVVIFYIVKQVKTTKQTHIIALSYILYEIVNTVITYRKISERELDAKSDSDYFSTQTFSSYFIGFGALLCPSTLYLYGWMIPIYASKYFFLMYGTDTTI